MRTLRDGLLLPLLAAGIILLASCATSVPVIVTKPAEINMSGNRVVAVLDFRYPEKGMTGRDLLEWAISQLTGIHIEKEKSPEQRAADYATSRVVMTLLETSYFQLVSPGEVARAMQGTVGPGTTAVDVGRAVGAQAIITGELYRLDSDEERSVDEQTYTDPNTGQVTKSVVPVFEREATVGLRYEVVNTSTGRIVASRSFEGRRHAQAQESRRYSVPGAQEMFEQIIDGFMPELARQLAPYQVRETRTLMKEKTKDPLMERADELVKGRFYDEALAIYLDVWARKGQVAAGFNAAILYEVTGELDRAVAQMREVVEATAERKAMREYNRMLQTRQERERVQSQL